VTTTKAEKSKTGFSPFLVLGHAVNDTSANLFTGMLPASTSVYGLSYLLAGLVAAVFNFTSSILQPLFGRGFASDVLASEMREHRVDCEKFSVLLLADLEGLIHRQHLVVAVVDAGAEYPFEDFLRLKLYRLSHLVDPPSRECSFGINEQYFLFETSILLGYLGCDAKFHA